METWSIVVAAGSGRRFGGPKQVELLDGRRVVERSVAAMAAATVGVVVVTTGDLVADLGALPGVAAAVEGGETRSASVRNGLAALPDSATHVLVHDAARPLVPDAVVAAVVEALADGADGSVPVVPVTDSLRTLEGTPVDRAGLVAVQTPQGFRRSALADAHAAAADATDDATLVSRRGGTVVHVAGDPINLKITDPSDLAVAEALLAHHRRNGARPS